MTYRMCYYPDNCASTRNMCY